MTAPLDPFTAEVIRSRLDVVADEMEQVLVRSAYSIVIKEGGDATCAIFAPADATSDGNEALAHAAAIPLHLGVMGPMVTSLLKAYPSEQFQDGDVYLLNDPYNGGTHLPDITVIMPVLCGERIVAFTAALAHHQDVGGMVASSMPTHATELYQEGLIVPVTKLRSGTQLNREVLKLMLANVRRPHEFEGDLAAQIAAVETGRRRVLELIDEFTVEEFESASVELRDRAERMTRAELAGFQDGTYRYHDYLDHDGVDLDRRVRIEAAVTIAGDQLHVDFTGTDLQTQGPINGPPSTALSAVAYVLRALTDPSIPLNGGSERPITMTLPSGTIVNPVPPSPVSLRAHLARRIVDVLLGAFAKAVPERAAACSASVNGAFSYSGRDPREGREFAITDTSIAAGMGGLAGCDGTDAIEMHTTNLRNLPTEALEMAAPVLIRRNVLNPDSGGPGQWRGGLGVERVIELRRGTAVSCFRHERHNTPAWGLEGGLPGARWEATLSRRGGGIEPVEGKVVFEMREGDVLRVHTGGGGGYGNPLNRDPAAVLADWLDGKVTLEHAWLYYGVEIDPAAKCIRNIIANPPDEPARLAWPDKEHASDETANEASLRSVE